MNNELSMENLKLLSDNLKKIIMETKSIALAFLNKELFKAEQKVESLRYTINVLSTAPDPETDAEISKRIREGLINSAKCMVHGTHEFEGITEQEPLKYYNPVSLKSVVDNLIQKQENSVRGIATDIPPIKENPLTQQPTSVTYSAFNNIISTVIERGERTMIVDIPDKIETRILIKHHGMVVFDSDKKVYDETKPSEVTVIIVKEGKAHLSDHFQECRIPELDAEPGEILKFYDKNSARKHLNDPFITWEELQPYELLKKFSKS